MQNKNRAAMTAISFNKKFLLGVLFLFACNLSFSQLKSVIIDGMTKEKVPYVNIWVENENVGTTSNLEGEFTLNLDSTKIIVLSAIGFKRKRISSDSIKSVLELESFISELEEIVVTPKKETKSLVIGEFDESIINYYYTTYGKPWIIAKYFEYKEDYSTNRYLNKIRVLTNSNIDDAKFNIRLYSINEEGMPQDYIYNERIIGIAKKGKTMTEIDISDLGLKFPMNGFFVAIEWLIIEENEYKFKYKKKGEKKKVASSFFEPRIGTVLAETDENNWKLDQGKWTKFRKYKGGGNKYTNFKGMYSLPAIELTLTN